VKSWRFVEGLNLREKRTANFGDLLLFFLEESRVVGDDEKKGNEAGVYIATAEGS
jgi:hypothetical protein